tara:strand:+ start:1114 stop:1782 length:669 start_codon:yes stop_codon:yes gene_type:complete
MIDLSNKFLFIHFRRTGGSVFSREYYRERKRIDPNYIETTSVKHFSYKMYLKYFNNYKVEDFYKMTIVRNPWDLVASDYWAWGYPPSASALLTKQKRKSLNYLSKNLNGKYYRSFREFLTRKKFAVYAKNRTMSDMIIGCEKDVNIVRYENYDNEINGVFNDLGMNCSYRRMDEKELTEDYNLRYGGISKRPIDYREMYTNTTKDLVYKLCKKDIKKFNYEF